MNQQDNNNREKERTPRRRRVIPPQAVWPLLFTLGNLVSGFAAIHYAYKGAEWQGPWGWSGLTMAGALIFLGMFLDSIDGAVARITDSVTELGAALDSLSDLVTCGVAPALMVLALVSSYLGDDGTLTLLGPDADLPWGKLFGASQRFMFVARHFALRDLLLRQSQRKDPTSIWRFTVCLHPEQRD